jgi:hypothetical protein
MKEYLYSDNYNPNDFEIKYNPNNLLIPNNDY